MSRRYRRGQGRCPLCERAIDRHTPEQARECIKRLLVRGRVELPEKRRAGTRRP